MLNKIKDYITEVADFPIPSVSYKDISPLLDNEHQWEMAIREMGLLVETPEHWIGVDARGFLFAAALSMKFGGGVVMCRKAGKLPPPTVNYTYQTEYSSDEVSIHKGSGTVVIVDDVLATGGTLLAVNRLAGLAGYDVIDNLVLIDLLYVPRIKEFDINVRSLIRYD